MPPVPGLRSPHAKVGRVIIFGRMLDKIRLSARDALPPEYQPNLGEVRQPLFDARCCRFLGVSYEDLRARVLKGGCDEEILAWAHAGGAARNDEECMVWNRFMSKIGWRDDRTELLRERVTDFGFAGENVETFCELLDIDEGRPLGGTRAWESPPISAVIVMGVSGCGKTTVGKALAEGLWWEFIEADDLHSAANVAKMSAGFPLTDADRAPWLAAVRAAIEACNGRGSRAVVACSALKEAYRLVLAPDPGRARFVHLRGDFPLIKGRLGGRGGHFMKESLLRSQFETLEEPTYALTLDASQPADVIIKRIREVLGIP
jgi:carbohydrate kinase (thermoresistant glucokinase family)